MAVEMKDSGVPYIGTIPTYWELHPLALYFDENRQNNSALETENALQFKFGEIIQKPKKNSELTDEDKALISRYTIVDKNDIVVNCLNLNYDLKSLRIGRVREHGIITSAYIVIRKRDKEDSSFFNYLLKAYDDQKVFHNMGTGIRLTLKFQELKTLLLPIPPLSERHTIVTFLDRKCGEIDELLDLETQMIDELKAYKQSIITEAVTRGLNPNVPMRNSGIEWIGEIPQHWKTTKLKFVGSARNGLTYTPTDVCDEEQGLLVLRSSNIQNGQLCFDDNVYVSKSVDSRLMMQEGDILICSRNGSASLVGKCALIRDNLNATFGAFMMRYRSNIDKSYTLYLINTTIGQYKPMFSTSTINQLTNEMIGSMQVAIPPLQEQRTIAEYLDSKCADIDALIALRQDKIDTLREYKKSLIFEYVTGKKQVV
jgi:type I restriction enzyme S subunit